MMCAKRHLPDIEQWIQSSGSNVIPRRARPGLAGLRPHKEHRLPTKLSAAFVDCFFFFFTLVTGPSRSLSLKLSD